MEASENQRTAKMRGGYLHEVIREWEHRADELLGDTVVHEEPAMLESHTEAAPYELEREVGHRLLAGEIDAVEAFRLLG